MIDYRYHCIFIHQRRAAGSSIIRAFAGEHPDVDRNRYNGGVLGNHWKRRSPPEDRYFVFSSVRNPFDRLVSGWRYLQSTRSRRLEEVLENLPTDGHDFRHLTQLQTDMIVDPVTGKVVVDDLIRFESLQQDFERICERIGKRPVRLDVVNSTERTRDYRQYFTPSARALAEAKFKRDLDFFNYEF